MPDRNRDARLQNCPTKPVHVPGSREGPSLQLPLELIELRLLRGELVIDDSDEFLAEKLQSLV